MTDKTFRDRLAMDLFIKWVSDASGSVIKPDQSGLTDAAKVAMSVVAVASIEAASIFFDHLPAGRNNYD